MDRQSLSSAFGDIEDKYGLPSGYLDQTAEIESNHNPRNHNELSGAKGMFQFIDSTAREYGLKNPWDPIASADAAARYAVKNQKVLRAALGHEPTAGELYLAHQQGPAGAIGLLRYPNEAAGNVVSPQSISANGGNPNASAGQFTNKWTSRYDDIDSLHGKLMAFAGKDEAPSGESDWEKQFLGEPGTSATADRILHRYDKGTDDKDGKASKEDVDRVLNRYGKPAEDKPAAVEPPAVSKALQGTAWKGKGSKDPAEIERSSPNERVAQGFEDVAPVVPGGDPNVSDPGQLKFNRILSFIQKNPTHPYSVDTVLSLAGLLGAKPGAALTAATVGGKLLGKAVQGGAFAEGMKFMGDKGSKTLEMLLELAK
jgi:hypothetical protein